MSSFENLRIVDNFYQTSLFFPMPTVIISTLCEDGMTNLGPYSLVQPYYIAGKDYYAMLLSCRNSSNTAQNILRNGKCALNFIDDNPKTFKEAVKLSWPGDKPSDKMPKCNFRLEKSMIEEETGEKRPMVLTDAIQVIECTWVRELDGADKDQPGELSGYEGPYHDFNGISAGQQHGRESGPKDGDSIFRRGQRRRGEHPLRAVRPGYPPGGGAAAPPVPRHQGQKGLPAGPQRL